MQRFFTGSAGWILLFWLLEAWAVPTEPRAPSGLTIPLRVRSSFNERSLDERGLIAQAQRNAVIAKYWGERYEKRSTGYNLIGDQDYDSGYYGSLAIGTPATSFDITLDTGSADLWVVGSGCGASCKGLTMFNPSSSSTFKNLSTSFDIVYGSGSANGYVAQDIVQMAGFSVSNQGFSVVDSISSQLLLSPVSGILGLGWAPLANSGETPFWQTLASSGAMDSALFGIQLRRYSNATNPSALEPGGEITLGYTNSTLYTGSIDYVNLPSTPSYWYLPLESLTVQGNSITDSVGSSTLAAIDTGTTNIAGPSSAIAAIYAQIQGSSPATGQFSGYYQFPCSTAVTVEFSFGGKTWSMSSDDFTFTSISSSQCIGAFFAIDSTTTSSTSPTWIIGDAFLKNVYSVFRYNPPSVGFAALSAAAIAQNGVNGAAPTPTIGSVSAAVTNTSGGAPRVRTGGLGQGLFGAVVMGALALMI